MVVFFDVCLAPFTCNVGIFLVFAGLAIKLAMPNIAVDTEEPKFFSQELVEKIAKVLNLAVTKSVDIVTWKCSSQTAKALVGLEVVRRASPWIGVSTIIFLVFNGTFLASWVVENKWELVERSVEPQIEKLMAKKEEWKAKIPKYTDLKDQKWD